LSTKKSIITLRDEHPDWTNRMIASKTGSHPQWVGYVLKNAGRHSRAVKKGLCDDCGTILNAKIISRFQSRMLCTICAKKTRRYFFTCANPSCWSIGSIALSRYHAKVKSGDNMNLFCNIQCYRDAGKNVVDGKFVNYMHESSHIIKIIDRIDRTTFLGSCSCDRNNDVIIPIRMLKTSDTHQH